MKSGKTKAGAVAAGHELTAAAAAMVLREGGNAYDAALAGMCAASVAEPVLSSLGGGGFLLARPSQGAPVVFDFFVQTPKRRRPADEIDFYPVVADFGTAQQEFHIGLGAMAVPGAVHGLFAVHERLGRMPVKELIQPAIASAREGFQMTPFQTYLFGVVAPIYLATEGARRIFASPTAEDQLIGSGEVFRNPDLAGFLEALGHEGPQMFYEGEIAEKVSATCQAEGGLLTREDFSAYATLVRAPLSAVWRGGTFLTNPPPSAGGFLIAYALRLMDRLAGGAPDDLVRLVQAMAGANKVRAEIETAALRQADEARAADLEGLLADDALARHAASIEGRAEVRRGTTHLSVIDGEGNAASLTLSNGEGCGYVVPGTGTMMNNMLGEEDLNPRGFNAWPEDVRMGSMMSPSLLVSGDAVTALGSGGSNRIRSAVLQVARNLGALGLSLEQAVAAPRVHLERDHLDIESGVDAETVSRLIESYPDHRCWPERSLFFGGVHVVRRTAAGEVSGAGDPRRGGVYRTQT